MLGKRMNEKGQGSPTVWIVVGVILALAVLIAVLYLGYTGIVKPGGEVINQLPSSTQAAVVACNGFAETGDSLKLDYCTQFREVELGSKEQYATCEYLAKEKLLETELDSKCEGSFAIGNDEIKIFCEAEDLKLSDEVNGVECDKASADALEDSGDDPRTDGSE